MTIFQKSGIAIILVIFLGVERPQPRNNWVFTSGLLLPGKLSSPVGMVHPLFEADLDGDGEIECLQVENGRATILQAPCDGDSLTKPLWRSPENWQVIQGMVTDLNRDGRPEATLLVWRPYQRWAIDSFLLKPGLLDGFQNNEGQSCHVILIGTKPRRPDLYRELWAGSAMATPFSKFAAADITGDGRQELVAIEGDYEDNKNKAGNALTIWEWNGFGFTLMTRNNGTFRNIQLVFAPDGRVHILTYG